MSVVRPLSLRTTHSQSASAHDDAPAELSSSPDTLALNKKNRVTLKSSSHRIISEMERNMTINKLKFNSLGIHGREEEEETLVHTWYLRDKPYSGIL
jgi:hypothetical protein